MTRPKITLLGEIRRDLEELLKESDDTRLTFGAGDLSFQRFKNRGPIEGPKVIQMQFNELYSVTLDTDAD